ncbi:MAG: transcriptional repressor NrdR [Planctomycetes bacterium]|nr:transcriptional repressor NrdR [Planctomycetota bacterium]MBI3846468.1 transcriptional repressor NrdR [Planctomycetota bacterium]
MRCPYCKADDDRVIDSRSSLGGGVIRRRRECLQCKRRFTSRERVEMAALRVIKKDGSRVPFDRQKIQSGLVKACEKRPVSTEQLEAVASEIEAQLCEMFDREVSSKVVGELVMERLRVLDQVAYIRFASVYREFKDVTDFVTEARPMIEGQKS